MKAKSIPKRISAALLCLALLTSLLPVGALAADEDAVGQLPTGELVCSCTKPCTEEHRNLDCPVCGAEGATPEGCALYEETAPDSEQPAPAQETAIAGFEPLAEDVAAQTVPAEGQPVLPDTLSAYQVGEDTELIPVEIAGVTWAAEPEYDPNTPGGYTFTAALPEGYALAEGVTLPTIIVTVEEAQTLEPQPPANDGISPLADTTSVKYLDEKGQEQTRDSVTVVTETNPNWGASDSQEHWYVVNSNVTIDQRVTVTGKVHLILADGYTLNASLGINVRDGNSLTIYGQAEGTGALTATGASWQAGIGGSRQQSGGTITVNGGTVNATGAPAAAGIGGGYAGVGNTITINGGIVKATGGSTEFGGGAGIGGGGKSSNAEKIVITGGVIIAEGGLNGAAGIGGGGHNGELKSISITGGWIQATGHGKNGNDSDGSANAIGGGANKSSASTSNFKNTVIFDGHTKTGTVYGNASLEENAEIPEGYTLTVPSGATLTIPEGVTLTNNGAITVSGGTLTNKGTIVDNGSISGTVSGDVRYPSKVAVTFSGVTDNTAPYGSTITITATMTKQTATNALTADVGTVDFWLGDVDTGTKLGEANVTSSGGTYIATLEVTLTSDQWKPDSSPYTITADFGGVAGGSGTGLVSNTGTAEVTVTKANQTAPGAPTMASCTTNSVTLNTVTSSGQGEVQYGYTTDGNNSDYHWQTGTTFSNLNPGTDYNFYARYAGNDYYKPSPASTGLAVTTLPEIATKSLDTGYVGVLYSATLKASADGYKTVTWALASSSSLPDGLTLDTSTGGISGTPKTAGTYSFTVQAAIKNGAADSEDVINTKELSITINQGTPVITATAYNGTTQTNTFDYGDTTTITGSITASSQAPSNGINSIAEPEQNQVGLYSGDTQLATAEVTDGSFTITYDTSKQGIQIGANQTLTVKYGGSSDLNGGSTTVTITLNKKEVTANVTNTITKVYDGNANAEVELAVASDALVNDDDEITVTGTGTYSSASAGESIGVTVSNIQTAGDDSAWYTVNAPTDVTGTITLATQAAPDAPTVIERTSSSVTLAALGTTGQGALEYGYTTVPEGEPGSWQTGTTFNSLTSGTIYIFYARYAGDNNYEPAVSELGTETSTLSNTDPNVINPGETVITDDGTKATNDGEKITITPDDGGTTTTITPGDGVTINGDGAANVPGGSTVQTGDGPEIAVGEDGATVGPDGGVTPPGSGSVTIGSGGDTTTITTPDSGTIKPNDDGTVTIPDGSTVQTGDGPEITLPGGGTVDPGTGAVTPDEGGSVVVGSGEDTTTITPPSGEPITPNDDGSVTVPDGSTVQTGDGPEMTLPGGGTVVPDTGAVTPDEGGSVVMDTGDGTTAITPPSGQPVTPNDDGSVTIPGGSTVTTGDSESITIPPEGGTIQPGGGIEYLVTVTFDSQGGSTIDSVDLTVNTPVSKPADPTRSGYSFQGWYTTADGDAEWNFNNPVPEDMTLYAHWSRNSSGGTTTYPPSITDTEHGDVTTSPSRSERGDTVTITPDPDAGYEVDEIIVRDKDGNEIEITQNPDGTYTFTQPSGKVTIEVTYRPVQEPEQPWENPFHDVDEDAWYADAVLYVYENGLMAGTTATTFSPDGESTRAQIVTILWRLAGAPADGEATFSDVAPGDWYADAAAWAAHWDISAGYGDGRFGAEDTITREQLAVMLYRYAWNMGYDLTAGENTNILSFTDADQISEYAFEALQWACGAGLLSGTGDGILAPQGQATRAQIAVIMMRFCQEFVDT